MLLIGVCGRREAGKDTVGAYLVERHDFRRYAFADKVKHIARRLGWNGEKDETGRALLQNLGMGCREFLGELVWIEALETSLYDDTPERAVVTDVRLPNEVDWIHRNGGIVVRLVRPAIPRDTQADLHVSETSVDDLDADVELVNDGTLDDLYAKAETVVANLKAKER